MLVSQVADHVTSTSVSRMKFERLAISDTCTVVTKTDGTSSGLEASFREQAMA